MTLMTHKTICKFYLVCKPDTATECDPSQDEHEKVLGRGIQYDSGIEEETGDKQCGPPAIPPCHRRCEERCD